jgi:leucine dehydrogenase
VGICAAANNQLARPEHGQRLFERGVVYAPDYVVNAGGLIEVSREDEWASDDDALKACERIYGTLEEIFEISRKKSLPTHIVADRLAEDRFR